MKQKSRLRALSLTLAMALVLTTMFGSGLTARADDPIVGPGPVETGVTLDKTTMSLKLGEDTTAPLVVTPIPSNGTLNNIKWESNNENVAKVSNVDTNTATVTVVGEGKAEITVSATITTDVDGTSTTSEIKTATCEVEVKAKTVTPSNIEILPTAKQTIKAKETLQFRATVKPDEATTKTVTWKSSDNDVATVSTTGLVTALKVGTVTITVESTEDSKVKATCEVNVEEATPEVTGVTISGTLNVDPNKTTQLTATVTPPGATATWKSSDETVATVSSTGLVTGKKIGTAVITATAGGKENTATVNVSGIVADTASPATVAQGKNITLKATAFGDAGSGNSGSNFGWATSNATIADVDQNGVVNGVAEGQVTITATAKKGRYPAVSWTVTVTKTTVADITVSNISYANPLQFSNILPAIKDRCRTATGAELSTVSITSYPTSSGTMYYNYSSANSTGPGLVMNEPYSTTQLNKTVFVPLASATGSMTIQYTATNTAGGKVPGKIIVNVVSMGDITYTTGKNTAIAMDADDFSRICRAQTGGKEFSYITFDTLPGNGTLYYDYKSNGEYSARVSTGTKYYRGSGTYLYKVSFVPNANYTGTVSIPFSGVSESGGLAFSGTITIKVTDAATGDISYSVAKNGYVSLRGTDFNEYSRRNGTTLNYVQFDQPGNSKGILYYNYNRNNDNGTKINSTTRYYYSSSPYIDDITFVPATGYTGTVDISFNGQDKNNRAISGVVSIQVGSGGDVSYSVSRSGTVDFSASDFNQVSRDFNGEYLDYIRFTSLPSSSKGTLYYKYTSSNSYDSKVTTSKDYRRSGSPNLDDVTFVAASNATGSVNIPFKGWDDDGDTFTGSISIQIDGGTVNGTKITYSTAKDTRVKFNSDDFEQASDNYDDYNLKYVRFSLPSSSKGTLYLNYSSSSNTGTKVDSSTSYYPTNNPDIDNISFVPDSGFTGTVEIDYDGWDKQNQKFTGTIIIKVGATSDKDADVAFKTTAGRPVTFTADAFNTASKNSAGGALDYVRFTTLPLSNVGTLYYNYTSGGALTKVSESTSYYRSDSPAVYSVTFVPAPGFSGKAEIPFTGWDTTGQRFNGKVIITVEQAVAQPIRYTVSGGAARFNANDFALVCRALTGQELVKVRFVSPAAYGRLYFGFENVNQYAGAVDSGTDCYRGRTPDLATVAFVPGAGITGNASITYTGEDANGYTYVGTVEITIPALSTGAFSDLGSYAWAADAINYLYGKGVVTGTSATDYSPKNQTKRGDFALMIVRAFQFSPVSGESFGDVPAGSYYAQAIATAKNLGVVQGDGSTFRPEAPVTRQDAMVMLQRALRAAGKTAPDGSAADLMPFSDRGSVYAYAVPAVGAMVRLGVVNGDDNGKLNPTAFITRAEMAVILYRALTKF